MQEIWRIYNLMKKARMFVHLAFFVYLCQLKKNNQNSYEYNDYVGCGASSGGLVVAVYLEKRYLERTNLYAG